MARFRRQGHGDFGDQLLAGFVHAHDGKLWVVGTLIRLQDVLHMRDKSGIRFGRNAPCLHQPGLDRVFLSACRTVSSETLDTLRSTTSCWAKSGEVQRLRPLGGV